ncbi:hypothetical protein ScPMuIL_016435 [Solemya velum]
MDKRLSEQGECGPRECGENGNCIADGAPMSSDPCEMCHCLGGGVACGSYVCDSTCQEEFSRQCCSSCKNAQKRDYLIPPPLIGNEGECGQRECRENGNCIADGAPMSSDPCEMCHCLGGGVACGSYVCDSTCQEEFSRQCCSSCKNAQKRDYLIPPPLIGDEGECGPRECRENGKCIADGAPMSSDPCEMCHCLGGGVACDSYMCDSTCQEEFSRQCCSSCKNAQKRDYLIPPPLIGDEVTCAANECKRDGKCIANGAPISDNPCSGCYCSGGGVICERRTCSRSCSDSFSRNCCSNCIDADI